MDSRGIDLRDDLQASETPEDVAILYSWANLHGAKYRDFSASRREYRAQIRHRAAQTLQERESRAAAEAEASAAASERAAQAAETIARLSSSDSQSQRLQALRSAEAAARRAATERIEALRRAEAADVAEAVARREEQEVAEAHASAERQALNYAESDSRRRRMAGPQPRSSASAAYEGSLGETDDPYMDIASHEAADEAAVERTNVSRQFLGSGRFGESSESYPSLLGLSRVNRPEPSPASRSEEPPPRRRPRGYRPDDASGVWQIKRAANGEFVPGPSSQNLMPVTEWLTPEEIRATRQETYPTPGPSEPLVLDPMAQAALESAAPSFSPEVPLDPQPDRSIADRAQEHAGADAAEASADPVGPAWLYAPATPPVKRTPSSASSSTTSSSSSSRLAVPREGPSRASGADTLQDSRERVASRWFALKGVFEHAGPELPPLQPVPQNETQTPLLAIFSLAGGVGKTSLAATLGRALSSLGEKVLLTDTTSHGLLPFYFGARELRPGVVRTFSPPSGSADAPISLVSYNVEGKQVDEVVQQQLAEEILHNTPGNHRVILDLSPSAGWLVRWIVAQHPTVLVPVAPDMNSVISLHSVERFFQTTTDAEGRALQPFYVLNQFDASLPLHLDVREVFRRQLGERLLRFVIRRSPAVSEALAEGMTVVDYAPEAPVSQDYLDIAAWLRSVSPPATAGFRNVRWSER